LIKLSSLKNIEIIQDIHLLQLSKHRFLIFKKRKTGWIDGQVDGWMDVILVLKDCLQQSTRPVETSFKDWGKHSCK
jgi:hypothetical protein